MKRETFAYLLTISQKEYKKTKKKEVRKWQCKKLNTGEAHSG